MLEKLIEPFYAQHDIYKGEYVCIVIQSAFALCYLLHAFESLSKSLPAHRDLGAALHNMNGCFTTASAYGIDNMPFTIKNVFTADV